MLSLSSMAPRPRLALLVLVILLVALAVRESHDVLPPPPASLHDVPQRLREASAMTAAWWRQRGVRRRPDDLLVDVTNATLGVGPSSPNFLYFRILSKSLPVPGNLRAQPAGALRPTRRHGSRR